MTNTWVTLLILIMATYSVYDIYNAWYLPRRNFVGRIITMVASLGFASIVLPWPLWFVAGFGINVLAIRGGAAILKTVVARFGTTIGTAKLPEPPETGGEVVSHEGKNIDVP